MELALKVRAMYTVAVGRRDDMQNRCRTGEECEDEELYLRRGSPLVCGIICFVTSSYPTCPCTSSSYVIGAVVHMYTCVCI